MNENMLRELAEEYPELIVEPFDDIYAKFGFEVLYYLIREFGGTYFYIPNERTVLKDCYAAQIRKEFNGGNCKKLASKYGISERSIWAIVKR